MILNFSRRIKYYFSGFRIIKRKRYLYFAIMPLTSGVQELDYFMEKSFFKLIYLTLIFVYFCYVKT